MKTLFASMVLLINLNLWAQDVNEADLFGDPSALVVESSTIATMDSTPPRGLQASGNVTAQGAALFKRDTTHPTLTSQMVASLYLDARSPDGTKAFAAIEGKYLADSSSQHAYLRELFLDFDLKEHLYLRAGKQVLQWGRCYFWNPSDLINVERKSFVERAGSLEGVYGLRTHIPFGTRANLYGFWDIDGAQEFSQSKGAFKAEIVMGGTETALSIWKRQGLDPVLAWDLSSRIGRWNLAAEAAFFPESFMTRYRVIQDTLYETPSKAFTPRAVISIGRSFDILEVQERLRVQYELYYNGLGYDENPTADSRWYSWHTPQQGLRYGPKALWLYQTEQVAPYAIGRYYAAFFTTFSRVFLQDLGFLCNGVMNLVDRSYMLATGFEYSTLNNLALQALLVRTHGPYPAEMTYSGLEWQIQLSAQYSF